MLRVSSSVRVLDGHDLAAVRELLSRDEVQNVFVDSRVRACGLDAWRLGAEMWGYWSGDRLDAVCYSGANLVPVESGPHAVSGFADRALRQGRRCSSIVGPANAVGPLWELLEPHWGAARDLRPNQPVLLMDSAPVIAPDPNVRRVRDDEIEILVPACVAMFTEEVGISPITGEGGGGLYRARVADLVRSGRAFARIEDGRVIFKAEIGAVTPAAAQVQGVWVHPDLRGQGISIAGMAAVVELTRALLAPRVSLYVNDYNLAARACYARVGFRQVGTFMSVLF